MTGRIEIDNVQPVVSCGAYPAKAVVGEVVPVSAAVWREGHEAVAATLVVRYLGPRYPQMTEVRQIKAVQAPERPPAAPDARSAERVKPLLVPMTMGLDPYVFHGQFIPDRVGLWTFRIDGWGDPIHTWRHGVLAKLDAGQGETELYNDLLVGATLFERAATGVPREQRHPLLDAAAALRDPRATRSPAPRWPCRTKSPNSWLNYPLRELVTRGEHLRRVGGPAAGPLRLLVRVVPAFDRRLGRRGQPGARHFCHRRRGPAAHCRDGIRRGVSAADPSDRQGAPQGPQQHRDRRTRRRRLAVGDRQRRGWPRCCPPRPGHHRRLRRLRRRGTRFGHGGGPGPGVAVRAGSSLGERPPAMVHRIAGRHHRLRGEPAEEVSGHLSAELRQRSRRPVRRGAACGAALD